MRVAPWRLLVVVVFAVAATAGAAAFTYVNVRRIVMELPIDLPAPPQVNVAARPSQTAPHVSTATLPPGGAPTQAAPPAGGATEAVQALPPRIDPTRVTVLLMGIDQRKGEKGPFRTDTMIVLSLDPVRNTAAMLSIPRDVYLRLPGYSAPSSPNRINNANVVGDLTDYPNGGGPRLAAKTVESLLGVPVQHYFLLNFDAFTTVIDAIGPIQVCPPERIFDDKYPDGSYGYMTVEFKAGCQELDSTRLLQYARVRHNDGDGDIGRARRQQEVIRAVRNKALTLGGISALLGKAGAIWESLRDSIKTDMTFDDLLQLARLAQDIPNIQSAVLTLRKGSEGQLLTSKLESGEEVLVPISSEVFSLVVRLFDAGQGGDIANPRASAEGAKIRVSNGSGVTGLAKTTADKMTTSGFSVVEVGNAAAQSSYGKSEIHVFTGKFETARYLAEVLGMTDPMIVSRQNGPPGIDIELIIGKDLAP